MLYGLRKNPKSFIFLPFSLIFLSVLIIFWSGLFNFFLQDDFYNISLGRDFNFWPTEDYAYRPIPFNLFGLVIFYIFRLNPVLSHAVLFLIHFFNIILLYKFLKHIFPHGKQRLFTVFIYGTSAIHFGTLYWVTASYISLGMTFLLLNLNFVLTRDKKLSLGKFLGFTVFYVLMLATSEVLFVFPVFLLAYGYLKNTKINKKILVISSAMSIISFLYRFIFTSVKDTPAYQIGQIKEIIAASRWYFLRGLNIPEGIQNMPFDNRGVILLLCGIIVSILILTMIKGRSMIKFNNIILGLVLFLIFGFPFFLLTRHLSPYYLTYAFIGLAILFSELISPLMNSKKKIEKIAFFSFCAFYVLISFLGVSYMNNNHWIATRAKIAEKYVKEIRHQNPVLPVNSQLVIRENEIPLEEIKISIWNEKALQLFYNDPSLNVIFNED